MSIHDRDYQDREERGEKFRRVLGRIFGDVENPLGWSLKLYTLWRITVRMHLLFIVYVVAQILWSIRQGAAGVGYQSIMMGSLFVIVLLHEYGHCIACRLVKGEANEILMWPLGGLAYCAPPDTWKAHLITVVGGPLVNVIIFPITAGLLFALGEGGQVFFNPFNPVISLGALDNWGKVALWSAHYVNLLVLCFNVLLPMWPLDGGRILHALLWRRMPRRQATEITSIVAFISAGVVAVIAIVTAQTILLAIALFAGLLSWRERQLARAEEEISSPYAASLAPDWREEKEAAPKGPSKRELKQLQREEDEQKEVDRILAKIASEGMGALTKGEKRTLERATERRRSQ
ncbi:MAG: site-2 protease family protein [Planctomycetota bacterium]|nr:site-2 protease family protein [Planctomycetota bacterium]